MARRLKSLILAAKQQNSPPPSYPASSTTVSRNHHLARPTSFTVSLDELGSPPSCSGHPLALFISITVLLGSPPSPTSASCRAPTARPPRRAPTGSLVRWSSLITNTCSVSTSAPLASPTCLVVLHHHLLRSSSTTSGSVSSGFSRQLSFRHGQWSSQDLCFMRRKMMNSGSDQR
ncbi:hypothetical protein Dimus_018220 [Dionaea muscipula]